jgi:hypothetical protein
MLMQLLTTETCRREYVTGIRVALRQAAFDSGKNLDCGSSIHDAVALVAAKLSQ